MTTTQSIIVYRNPAEAAFWESGMLVPIGGAMIAFLLMFLVLMKFFSMLWGEWKTSRSSGYAYVAMTAAGAAAVLVFNWLSI